MDICLEGHLWFYGMVLDFEASVLFSKNTQKILVQKNVRIAAQKCTNHSFMLEHGYFTLIEGFVCIS